MNTLPLVVDLDGTLIRTDMLHESALRVFKEKPFEIWRIPVWLAQGKAILKQKLAHRTDFDPALLPYNHDLLEWLKQQKQQGRKIVLCTASDRSIADKIAGYLNIFDEVLASNGNRNLAGTAKAETLEKCFGAGGFDYAGNSTADLAVWERARRGIVVNAAADLAEKADRICEIEQVFPKKQPGIYQWGKMLRLHQWLKNLLLFIPLLAAHQIDRSDAWANLLTAFFSFSFCASSVYIANDLFDLESDRRHPRKRNRPLASGSVPAWAGVVSVPVLLLVSLGIGLTIDGNFIYWLGFYYLLTCAYSWGLKRLMLIDCLILAMLYTFRIVAGAAAVQLPLSFWLLGFSVFLFLSLAFVKRYAELEVQIHSGHEKIHGRGYYTTDAPLIQTLGITAGYASALVLALYLNSDAVLKLYRIPEIIWGAIPIVLFWISWMWMQAHRGNMHDDPLVYAVKDKASLIAGTAFAAVIAIGAWGWPW